MIIIIIVYLFIYSSIYTYTHTRIHTHIPTYKKPWTYTLNPIPNPAALTVLCVWLKVVLFYSYKKNLNFTLNRLLVQAAQILGLLSFVAVSSGSSATYITGSRVLMCGSSFLHAGACINLCHLLALYSSRAPSFPTWAVLDTSGWQHGGDPTHK